ncbi:GTPase activating protein (Evi5), putative [Talaromyces stipitatus ATCC 10500]|uniref:GTPase activating protein (Evi5), putative n=1 Tax=Talaromyces stipitatus (strain ATCC 10500 / CBS 375.48 / QM 6759 / NRRL 1006) TaxID=441959 RepID=B8M039_TALSN|nr:GTPase activating protein (Evi5), putative [Talaromyces stipitatus ATCC 10500]EED21136.1 GTPase activating protein (Evi5), putative [Talaromyces stipitatus ATCC 10500]
MSIPSSVIVHPEDVSSPSLAEELISPVTTDSMVTVPLSDRQSFFEGTSIEFNSPTTPVDERADEASIMENAREVDLTPKSELAGKADETSSAPREMKRQSTTSIEAAPNTQEGYESSSSTESAGEVDWEKLDKSEEQQPRTQGTDESTALLLARLEQENNALATNPKSGLAKKAQRQSRPPSIQQLRRLVNDPRASLRYSQLQPPPMTELEFWAALVADYPSTAQRLPTLTSHKIRAGVPPPLRGVVWPSIAGARDTLLIEEFGRLCGETSPYEGLIGKDIGRSFPNVEMFRDPNGEGQQMLGRVLKCFSLYDTKIGYCQGLGFVVGPLLMHMTDAESFCVLIRLMEHYDLRSCFLPDLSGLHLRIYQFQNLLSRHLPALFAHLQSLNIEPIYVSQWFLSFFAVTCPLPMLLRIYDVLLLEGASETLMRVALSLMQRNEKKIMGFTEFEDVLQFLLSRSLWDTYAFNADDLVNDFVSLTPLVSRESLRALEASYSQSQGVPTGISFPQMQATASRFLGRLWAGSHKSLNLPSGRPESTIRRSPSKQSMASTLNSMETSVSDASTAPTEVSIGGDQKVRAKSAISHRDRDLHSQIEDLLTALSDMQREQADLVRDLQREREEREEDREISRALLNHLKQSETTEDAEELVSKAEERFSTASKRDSILQTKHQLRDEVGRWKEKHEMEVARCIDLSRQLDEHEHENSRLKEELREARSRIQDGYREKQRLERVVQDLRSRKSTSGDHSSQDSSGTTSENESWPTPSSGLREFKLGRTNSKTETTRFPKRSSSLGVQSLVGSTIEPDNRASTTSGSEDSLLLELVTAKTAEAVAKQELEEVKAKLDSLRRLMNGHSRVKTSTGELNFSATATKLMPETVKAAPTGGGFFGWGRRSASTAGVTEK